MDTPIKRKRGRPRKNIDKIEKTIEKKEKKEEDDNIVLFLALSSDSEDEDKDNETIQKTDTMTSNNKTTVISAVSSDSSNDNGTGEVFGSRFVDKRILMEEIKKRDLVIKKLRQGNNGNHKLKSYNNKSTPNIDYHCTIMCDSKTEKTFIPKITNQKCWWDDHQFDTLPVYIPNKYRNGKYYVFGNFCSFNCAGKYNSTFLNDGKCLTRLALLKRLYYDVSNDSVPFNFAQSRELLYDRGGTLTIEQFRNGFNVINNNLNINMPPMIPLVHVINRG